MAKTYKHAGDTWQVYLGEDAPHPGVLPLIFHCTSNPSHGWRVAEVAAEEFGTSGKVDGLTGDELDELFERAQPFDYSHDPKAREWEVGDTPLR